MTLDPWLAKVAILVSTIVLVAIRLPAGQRSRGVTVVKSRRGPEEIALLMVAWLVFLGTLLWLATPVLEFAEYALHPVPFAAGLPCLALGLWFMYRSHQDLGTNWSVTLEVREKHQLVTKGIYRRVRHPMYMAFLLYAVGQALTLPNWMAGPSYLVAFGLLFALRLGPEERMMREEFGADYDAYVARTKRLVPGIW